MLTGRPPFGAETSAEIMFQHLEKIPARVSTLALDCPIWLDALIGQLLEKEPEKRPRDAAAVQQALIEIEQKVAVKAGMSLAAITGGPTSLNVTGDTLQSGSLFRKKKKKKGETGPIWERMWFLASCLAAILALLVWAVWPAGEEQLFAQAQALMETDDTYNWRRAVEKPLADLQRRFPEGKHADDVQRYIDKFEMYRAEERYKNHNRLGQEPSHEGERLYAQAYQYERFGDLVTAYEKYNGMLEVLKDKEDYRPFLNLARRQISQIDAEVGHLDRRKIVDDNLIRAEDLYHEGKVLEARRIWNSIVSLYGSNRELSPQVQHARARLDDKKSDLPRREDEPEQKQE
jgi:hypothetical protein